LIIDEMNEIKISVLQNYHRYYRFGIINCSFFRLFQS